MLKNTISTMKSELLVAIQRFFIPSIFSLLFCIIVVSSISKDEQIGKLLMILSCGCFWFISIKLLAEGLSLKAKEYYTTGIIVFCAMAWCIYIDSKQVIFFAPCLSLSIFIAPFLNKASSDLDFWVFAYQVFLRVFITVILSIILYSGLSSIIYTLSFLFGLNFYNGIYIDAFLVIATLFSPIMIMAGIPLKFGATNETYPKNLRLILTYAFIPLFGIYTIILYSYVAKILIAWDLPKGIISLMVSTYGCVGVITYIASCPFQQNNKIIGIFSKYCFPLLFVPLILLAIAIGVRINNYGITTSRYIVLLCLIWLTLSSIFALTKYRTQLLRFIVLSLVALWGGASFGPWGMLNVVPQPQISSLDTSQNIQDQQLEYFSLSNPSNIIQNMDIAGYDHIISFGEVCPFVKQVLLANSDITLSISAPSLTNSFIVKTNDDEEVIFELSDMVREVRANSNIAENFVLEKTSTNLSYKLIVNSINGTLNKNDSAIPVITHINITLLIKRR